MPVGRMLLAMEGQELRRQGKPPAQFYVWTGRSGPFDLLLTPDVFAPTHTSHEIAEGLVVNPGDTVIDVGAGSGVLSFVAARLGAHRVCGTDVNRKVASVARANAERLGLYDRVELRQGNLF